MICPWDSWSVSQLTFCEKPICAWITHPANTWSNVGYLLVGIVLVRKAYRTDSPLTALFGTIACVVAFGSAFFHASGTYVGEVADLGSMFLLSSLFLVLNIHRATPLPVSGLMVLYVVNILTALFLMLKFKTDGIPLFATQITIAGLIEIWLRWKGKPYNRAALLTVCSLFIISYISWWLDYARIICDPDFHWLTGHAVWHLVNAFCFLYADKFYSEIKVDRY